jgi:ribonuclease G
MATEILVNIGPQESRIALVENGAAQEFHIQRTARHGLVGSIYKGVIKRVLPGMQAAFVDIGLERTAFLHVADMYVASCETTKTPPPIERLLQEGQEVLVQILKDPLGTKGARLTTLLSIPSRYLVLMPFERHVGVSSKIEDEASRDRLRAMLDRLAPVLAPNWGVIARTAAEGAEEIELEEDLKFLTRLWNTVEGKARTTPPCSVVHTDLPLSMRFLRDMRVKQVDRIRIDNPEECQRVQQFANTFFPGMEKRVELYTGDGPIFDLYGVEDDLNRALERKVELKCGGHLIVDQTEAMTTIDVNTGAFTGHRSLDETILKTNLEATSAIARQLRLRNLGGIIIVDFIDMKNEEHRAQVLRAFERELSRDSARTHLYPFSPLGLIQMTRKRTRESLGHILCEPCPTCDGRGYIKTVDTVCHEIARDVQRSARLYEAKSFLVLAAPNVVARLSEEQSGGLAELEAALKRPIKLQAEALYAQDSYDVVPL